MAVKGSGTAGKAYGAKDQTSSVIGRDGAAKRTQNSFPVHSGFADQTNYKAGPAHPGSGPDASAANPLERAGRGKVVKPVTSTSWGQKDADGRGLDSSLADKVLAEAANFGKVY